MGAPAVAQAIERVQPLPLPSPSAANLSDTPAVVFDESSASIFEQDEFSTTWVDANGVYKTSVSGTPLNVKVDGKWQRASDALVDQGAAGLVGTRHPLNPRLSRDASDRALVQVSRDGFTLSFAFEGAAHAKVVHPVVPVPGVPANEAIYRSVLPYTDLTYEAVAGTLKETLILQKKPSGSQVAYMWTVDAPGLTPVKGEFGDLEFRNSEGVAVFVMPAPMMWDSSGVAGASEPESAPVDYDIVPAGASTFVLTLRPDVSWLRDQARVYPVFVDPTLATGSDYMHAIKSDGVTTSGSVKVGNPAQSTIRHWRTITHYPFQWAMDSKYQITDAYISATKTSGTVNCYGGGIYEAMMDNFDGGSTAYPPVYLAYFPVCATGGGGGAALAQTYSRFVKYSLTQGALLLTGGENWSSNVYSYKVLSTTMTFTYVAPPTVTDVTAATPQNGALAPAAPIMQAVGIPSTGFTDMSFQYVFTTTDPGGVNWTSPWVPNGPYQVPLGVLTPGKTYSYAIKGQNVHSYLYSPEVTLAANVNRYKFVTGNIPDMPSTVTVDGDPLTVTVVSDTTRPVVSAEVTDPDGVGVRALFTVKQGGVVIVDGLAGSATTTESDVSSVQLPYALAPGLAYTIEVQGFDGQSVGPVFTPGYTFTGPPRYTTEIPYTWDKLTGAV